VADTAENSGILTGLGHTWKLFDENTSITNVGSTGIRFSVIIENEAGENVTGNYAVKYTYGNCTLTVKKRPVYFVAESNTKTYDGQPLSAEPYVEDTSENTGILTDLGHSWSLFGGNTSRTNAGETQISFSVVIKNEAGEDVTGNYAVNYAFGTLTVRKRPVDFVADSNSKIYDGRPLSAEPYVIAAAENSGILTGLGHSWNLFGGNTSITNVGAIVISFSVIIKNEAGEDVTGNYDVRYSFGMLTVQKRQITVLSESKTKTYDAMPLLGDAVMLKKGEIPSWHKLVATSLTSQTDVGTVSNEFFVDIKDENEESVIDNYEVTLEYGNLTVTPYTVYVSTTTESFEYDATPHKGAYVINENTPLCSDNHYCEVIFAKEETEAGSYENVIILEVKDRATNDCVYKENYKFEYVYGNLIVYKRKITVQSRNAEKTYDGTELTCPEWDIVSDKKPVEGHDISVTVTGRRLSVGSSPNVISEVIITDNAGFDVTHNYEIQYNAGKLVVLAKNGGSGGASGDAAGNFSKPQPDDTVVMKINANNDGTLYLRCSSAGDYTGSGWSSATEYAKNINGEFSMNYLLALLCSGGLTSQTVFIDNCSSEYVLPYYPIPNEQHVIQKSDVRYVGITPATYIVNYYDIVQVNKLLNSIDAQSTMYGSVEAAYREFVYANYLQITDSARAYMEELIKNNNFSRTDSDIIDKVAKYVSTAAKYNLNFDESLNFEPDVVVSFLKTYKEGICQHFASAGTLLFRTLGIPARYACGYKATAKANTQVSVKGSDAHAWVEVYLDGKGWIPVEVTGGSNGTGGGGKPNKQKLTITPIDSYFKYSNGFSLTPHQKVSGLNELTKKGYTYDVTISGKRSEVGKTDTYIESFTLRDAAGTDVTDNYDIKMYPGKLVVYYQKISVFTENATKVYDGKPLKTTSTPTLSGSLIAGHRFEYLRTTAERTAVGKKENSVEIKVVDQYGNDVTYYYYFEKYLGILEVKPCEVTITAGSLSVAYDGSEHSCAEFTVTWENGEELEGVTITAVCEGSQTEIGVSENVITEIIVTDANGNDIGANFKFNCIDGKIEVIA